MFAWVCDVTPLVAIVLVFVHITVLFGLFFLATNFRNLMRPEVAELGGTLRAFAPTGFLQGLKKS